MAGPITTGGATGGTAWEVLRAFLRLGLTSFGGPVAHLGYFRTEFVERRRWLDERAYAELVGLCQFLPGPASSQVGFCLGLLRAGWPGALAAWAGFTLPSALLMLAFAAWISTAGGGGAGVGPLPGLLHGLKLVAVAVVAQAVWGMARSLCPDRGTATIATAALVTALLAPAAAGQVAAIALGALAGLALGRDAPGPALPATPSVPMSVRVSRRAGAACLGLFAVLLAASFLPWAGGTVAGAFYRSGALVFGGGHVVLPLLHDAAVAPGWVTEDAFVAGYGAAQAVPGPLFTFAAFLGAAAGGLPGAATALASLFLPGLLLAAGALPFWDALRRGTAARAALRGANAAVVGLLAAALYDPVWTGAVRGPRDLAVAAAGFVALVAWRAPPLAVVAGMVLVGLVMGG